LEALCGLAIAQKMPEATLWVHDLQNLAARSGMRELTVRALLHRATLGDLSSAVAARLLSDDIDSAALASLCSTSGEN
jgi:hypothetical protein